MVDKLHTIEIKRVGINEDVGKIVNFHMQIFRDNFTDEIGKWFLQFYFKRILSLPGGVVFVAKSGDGDIVGFTAGLASKKGFHNLKFVIFGAFATLWQLIVRPPTFVLILRHLKRIFTSSGNDCDAELLSLAVKKEFRQSGIGKKLVSELEEFFRSKDVLKYEAFTDMVHGKGYVFYSKLGFKLGRKVDLFGLVAHLYFKDIKTSGKVLLLNPGSPNITMRGLIRERPTEIGFCWPSVDIVIMSGLLNKKGYGLDYLDASIDRLSVEDVNAAIRKNNIKAVVSLYSRYLKENDINFLKQIKDVNPDIIIAILPDIQFVLHQERAISFLNENDWLDAIVLNITENDLGKYLDGERSKDLKNLCYRINKEAHAGPKVFTGGNDCCLPVPRHDLFRNKRYFLPQSRSLNITTTIMHFGCPYNCDFCMGKLAYEKSFCRSPENMLDEFEYIVSCGFREVYIRDLTFGLNRSKTTKFCELLIEKKVPLRWVCTSRVDTLDEGLLVLMKKAGCMCIEFGVESAIDSTNEIHKKGIKKEQVVKTFSICRKIGTETTIFMILGFPEETMDDINESLRFCFDLKADFLALNLANALPGTEFGKAAAGSEDGEYLWESISYFDTRNFSHPDITRDEINLVYKRALGKFYLRPGFIFGRLSKLNSIGALLRVAQMGAGVVTSSFLKPNSPS